MGGINEATEVARGISEQGFLVMTAAFFLVLSAMMMVACFKWFKSIITKSMEDYGESLKELIEKTNDQNNMLSDISEGLRTCISIWPSKGFAESSRRSGTRTISPTRRKPPVRYILC